MHAQPNRELWVSTTPRGLPTLKHVGELHTHMGRPISTAPHGPSTLKPDRLQLLATHPHVSTAPEEPSTLKAVRHFQPQPHPGRLNGSQEPSTLGVGDAAAPVHTFGATSERSEYSSADHDPSWTNTRHPVVRKKRRGRCLHTSPAQILLLETYQHFHLSSLLSGASVSCHPLQAANASARYSIEVPWRDHGT